MYGFNELQNKDIKAAGELIKTMHIPHVSWYALEVKPGSMLYQQQYPLHDECIETQLQSIIQLMHELGYQRYEVSNWCKSSRCESLHNKAYWLTQDWKAIGLGSCGFENQTYYENVGTIKHWTMHKNRYTKYDYYFQIMLMGLRLQTGLCLSHRPYKAAYKYFKNKLKYVHIEDNHLVVDNLNLLDNTLIDLM
jgi:oxygen-independent coproporphyrinogen-3 oxidase